MLKRKHFCLGGLPGYTFVGYTDGTKWNGWECPLFDIDEARRMGQVFTKEFDGSVLASVLSDEHETWWVQVDMHADPPLETFTSVIRETEDGTKALLPIGYQAWTWDEAEEEP